MWYAFYWNGPKIAPELAKFRARYVNVKMQFKKALLTQFFGRPVEY